jgi:hypothetical protein
LRIISSFGDRHVGHSKYNIWLQEERDEHGQGKCKYKDIYFPYTSYLWIYTITSSLSALFTRAMGRKRPRSARFMHNVVLPFAVLWIPRPSSSHSCPYFVSPPTFPVRAHVVLLVIQLSLYRYLYTYGRGTGTEVQEPVSFDFIVSGNCFIWLQGKLRIITNKKGGTTQEEQRKPAEQPRGTGHRMSPASQPARHDADRTK